MIAVVDLGLGNVKSVCRALSFLKVEHLLTSKSVEIAKADRIILPGVGNFYEASDRLRKSGLFDVIRENVLNLQKPLFGICLGMQLLCDSSEEGGGSEGLGLIKGRVRKLRAEEHGLRLPHIGWNDVASGGLNVFKGVEENSCFYFVHSFEVELAEPIAYAKCNYGCDFVAAFEKANIVGCQFHPEKSQGVGLKLLSNFARQDVKNA